ncbi:alpha/beta hydrolase [Actinomycetospora corticicola]|uniref:Pimeloyl-ACP methyl ester carboxylesterase n=1 Tax=Actinomycetospora corticicola TaxID=663602 RepID=A0A7Y9DXD1_9PSEU|nr:alpha/beta hydrolase [Actinomycetospora corticicola]NYD37257.1 pimeloyl-ACP methyl ester carboxylesterase [Actinomycetospora corticicola]
MSSITYVLVHGAFSTAAAWGPVARDLALRGHRVVAVDLPGHGLDARDTGMVGVSTADDVAAVTAVVRAVDGPVVLVGHSRGGLTVTAVANAVPERLAHVVYVSAWCCVVGGPSVYASVAPSALDRLAPRLLTADPAEVAELRVDFRTTDPEALDALQDALLADGSRTELLAMLATMDGRESLAVDEAMVTVDPDRWGRVPRTYVRLGGDRALMPALQDRFVADSEAVGLPFRVVDLASSHLGVQLRPGPLVDVLTGLPS